MQRQTVRWGVIALWFIIFFPLGIWLMYKKVVSEADRYAQNGKVVRVYGWVIFSMGMINVVNVFSGKLDMGGGSRLTTFISLFILFLGGGLFLVYKGKQLILRGQKYNRYVSVVSSIADCTISNIAESYPDTYENTLRDLQKMMEVGFFSACRLDLANKRLIRPAAFEETMPKTHTQKCSHCGATNRVVHGQSATCEYCGTPLQ